MVYNHKRRTDPKEFSSIVEKGPTSWRLSQWDWVVCLNGVIPTVLNYWAWRYSPYYLLAPGCLGQSLLFYGFRCINQERPDFATVTNNAKLSKVVTQIYFSVVTMWQLQFDWGLYSMSLHSRTEADRTATTGILFRKEYSGESHTGDHWVHTPLTRPPHIVLPYHKEAKKCNLIIWPKARS